MKKKGSSREGRTAVQLGLFTHRIALVGAALAATSLVSLVLLPLLTRSLPVADYGLFVELVVTITLSPLLMGLGLPGALVRFLAAERDRVRLREAVWSVMLVASGIAAAGATLLALLAPLLAPVLFGSRVDVVHILALTVFIECAGAVTFNYYRALQKIRAYSAFLVMQSLVLLAALYLTLSAGLGIIGAAWSLALSRALPLAAMVVDLSRDAPPVRPTFARLREFLSYSVPTMPTDLSNWMLSSCDRYIIGIMLGTAFTGLYNPGYSLGAMVLMLVSPLGFILPAALSKLYDEKEVGEVRRYLRHSLKYFLLVAMPGAAGLAVLSRPLLAILTTPEIAAEGWVVTPLVAGAMVLWGCALIASQVMVLVKRTTVSGALMVAAALLNLALNILLVPLLGILGAAFSTLIAYGVSFAAMVHLSRGYIPYGIDGLSMAKGLAASLIMAAMLAYGSPSGLLPTALWAAGGLGLYLLLLAIFRTFSPAEYAFFRSLAGLKPRTPQAASK